MARTADVVAAIKDMILAGELRPGDRLPTEKDLGARLRVSRGPLREGVSALAAMGVLDTRQGDGTYVTSLEPGLLMAPLSFAVDVHNAGGARPFLAVRRLLESEAAALAAMNIDADGLAAAERALAESEAAAQPPADIDRFFAADLGFHRAVAAGAGNPSAGRTYRDPVGSYRAGPFGAHGGRRRCVGSHRRGTSRSAASHRRARR